MADIYLTAAAWAGESFHRDLFLRTATQLVRQSFNRGEPLHPSAVLVCPRFILFAGLDAYLQENSWGAAADCLAQLAVTCHAEIVVRSLEMPARSGGVRMGAVLMEKRNYSPELYMIRFDHRNGCDVQDIPSAERDSPVPLIFSSTAALSDPGYSHTFYAI